MADFFTSEHFKLLNKWRDQKRDKSNPEQNRAYEELAEAYKVTEAWAREIQRQLFPSGRIKVHKRPTSQANKFLPYNWARIYPTSDSPVELAYTVGIDAKHGFITKIDTVHAIPSLRSHYEELRGPFSNQSPIIALIPTAEGLATSLTELVKRSIQSIEGFGLRYEQVARDLRLSPSVTDEDIVHHFGGKSEFSALWSSWSPAGRATFLELARITHAVGLDWWFVETRDRAQFGRKKAGSKRAARRIGTVEGIGYPRLSLHHPISPFPVFTKQPLNDELVNDIEQALADPANRATLSRGGTAQRPGLWPNQLGEESATEEGENDRPFVKPHPGTPFNRIYYGPPGTGKTYKLEELLQKDYEQPRQNATGEEQRQRLITDKITPLTWWEAIAATLHDLGGSARVGELIAHPFIQAQIAAKSNQNIPQTLWGNLQHHSVEESTTIHVRRRFPPAIFDKSSDSVWRFAGDWREVCADVIQLVEHINNPSEGSAEPIRRHRFVTFHQSYGYEEFVEGLRPRLDNEAELGYEIRKGTFRRLCEEARADPAHRYAMVIDEINRGNVSRILGELITLIEIDKRDPLDGSQPPVEVTLAYSGERFSVPKNVDIIATMNTADRSLALVDTALRRRFEFIELMPNTADKDDAPLGGLTVPGGDGEVDIDIRRMLEKINQRIEVLYDRDHTIGHAYFITLKALDNGERLQALGEIFRKRIFPLLEEYFFDDWRKIQWVLGDHYKLDPDKKKLKEGEPDPRFVTAPQREDELTTLFGETPDELEGLRTNDRFSINERAFTNPAAYRMIYEIPQR